MKIKDEKLKSCKKKKLPIISGSPLLKFKHINKSKVIKNRVIKKTIVEDSSLFTATNKEAKKVSRALNMKTESDNPSIINMRRSDNDNTNFQDIVGLINDVNTSQEDISPLKSLMSCNSPLITKDVHNRKSKDRDNRNCERPTQRKYVNIKSSDYPTIVSSKDYINRLIQPTSDNISGIKLYDLNISKFLLVMKPGSHLHFVGTIELELITGSIEIFGYTLDKENQKLLAFSLQGSSNIYLKANENGNVMDKSQLSCALSLNGLSDKLIGKVLKESEGNAFLIISRNKDHISSTVWPVYFETHHSSSIFPPNYAFEELNRKFHYIERRIHCLFGESLQDYGFKFFCQVPEWSDIEKDLTSQDLPKTVLCGGKSVGKSTFLRYLVNRSLAKCGRVLVLDFDPGQCEFTPPGCISISSVDQPLLGPNYTHLKQPLRSIYLGEVDVTKCPECYIEGCNYLIKYAKENYGSIPWLINTMGFTKGIGMTFTCGIIQNVNPTTVVQIESKNRKLNFPSRLDSDFVLSQNNSNRTETTILNYQLYCVPSGSEQRTINQQNQRGMSPAEARILNILSYLSSMLSSKISTLSEVQPYMIGLDHIELRTITDFNLKKPKIAAAMNSNMVALCNKTGEDDAFPNCFGFGVVRGIDWKTNMLYLITPVAFHVLQQVNCLIKGNILLPESLQYNQGPLVTGTVPYLSRTSGGPTARYVKRDFRTLPVTARDQK